MTYYSFTIIYKETESKQNQTLFTAMKQNANYTRHFGPIYIDFMSIHPILIQYLISKKKLNPKISFAMAIPIRPPNAS